MTAAEILAGGTRLVRTQPRAVAFWGLLYLAVCVGAMLLVRPMFADMMVLQQQALAARAAGLPPPTPPAGLGAFFAGIVLLDLALLLVFAAIFAAAVRAVAHGGHDRFGFLRFGADELRLIGLGIVLAIVFLVATFVLGLVMGLIAVALAAALGADATVAAAGVTAVVMLAMAVGMIWAQVRMSLAGALTMLRGRIVVREAWRATRGRFWTLFGVYLLIGIAYVAVTLLIVAIVSPGLLAAWAGGMQPDAMQAALAQQQAVYADPFSVRTIVGWLAGLLVMSVGIAFTFGAVATAAIGFDRQDHAVSAVP